MERPSEKGSGFSDVRLKQRPLCHTSAAPPATAWVRARYKLPCFVVRARKSTRPCADKRAQASQNGAVEARVSRILSVRNRGPVSQCRPRSGSRDKRREYTGLSLPEQKASLLPKAAVSAGGRRMGCPRYQGAQPRVLLAPLLRRSALGALACHTAHLKHVRVVSESKPQRMPRNGGCWRCASLPAQTSVRKDSCPPP